jgi:hypothetical protein
MCVCVCVYIGADNVSLRGDEQNAVNCDPYSVSFIHLFEQNAINFYPFRSMSSHDDQATGCYCNYFFTFHW